MDWMFFWGMVSLLQITLFPGAILIKLIRPKVGWVLKISIIFSLSLLSNYLFVSLLAFLGIYTRPVCMLALVLELVVMGWLYRDWLKSSLDQVAEHLLIKIRTFLEQAVTLFGTGDESGSTRDHSRPFLLLASTALGLLGVAWVINLILRNLGGVFNTWDAILSWNRWATAWASGVLPADTGYYPQLLPANWSLTYVLIGNPSIQIFARSLGPLFLFFILLLFLDLGFRSRSYGVLLGAFFTWIIFRGYLSEFIADGYADLPAAFLGFLSVMLLLNIKGDTSQIDRRRLIWLSALLSAAAALTKQSGVYLLLLFPLLAAVLPAWDDLRAAGRRWKEILLPFGVSLLIAGSFYMTKSFEINRGLDESNVSWVTQGIYGGATWMERASLAYSNLGIYRLLFFLLFPVFFFVRPPIRWLIIAVVVPYTLIWVSFFSYDTRNLAVILPFLGLSVGLGIQGMTDMLLRALRRYNLSRIRVGFLVLASVFLLLAASFWINDGRLTQLQEARQKQVLSPQLNSKLYQYFQDKTPDRKIISQYPLNYLPGFENQQVSFWFDNLADFLNAQNQPEVGYILLPANVIPEIQQVVEEKLAAGEYQFVFEDSSYLPVSFLRIIRDPNR